MKLTSFNNLKSIISEFGANPIVAKLDKKLVSIGINIEENSGNVVVGQNGIYYVDPEGALTKVIIHIVDNNLQSGYATGLKDSILNEDFESPFVLNKVHKYHLLKCKTIERAEAEGWRKHRYRMSRRQDGYFFYRYIEKEKVLLERDKQKLYVCKNCLNKLDELTKQVYVRESFNLEDFLSSSFENVLNVEKDGKYANTCEPNIYQRDWNDISRAYRKSINFQCENPSCPKPDLSEKKLIKYLHTHHVSFDKTNNNYSELRALCIYCHANQPSHSHMKRLPDYKNYIKIIGVN